MLVSLALAGCGAAGVSVSDPGLSTPERTVSTLLVACGLSPQRPQVLGDAWGLPATDAVRVCFADLRAPADPRAVRVVRALAAVGGRGEVILYGDRATLRLPSGPRLVFRRGRDRAYRISLADSVLTDGSAVGADGPTAPLRR